MYSGKIAVPPGGGGIVSFEKCRSIVSQIKAAISKLRNLCRYNNYVASAGVANAQVLWLLKNANISRKYVSLYPKIHFILKFSLFRLNLCAITSLTCRCIL
jgi:hypothetical protein